MAAGDRMTVAIAWVCDRTVRTATLEVAADTTVGAAVAAAAAGGLIDERLATRLAAGDLAAAVFGRTAAVSDVLDPGDRIELLEGLRVDPKTARARRAELRRAARGDTRWRQGG